MNIIFQHKLLLFSKVNPDETYARIDHLCNTIRNENEVPLITITAAENSKLGLKIPLQVSSFNVSF